MKDNDFSALVCPGVLGLFAGQLTHAAAYPNKTVQIVNPFSPVR